jgi:hypothetical protein
MAPAIPTTISQSVVKLNALLEPRGSGKDELGIHYCKLLPPPFIPTKIPVEIWHNAAQLVSVSLPSKYSGILVWFFNITPICACSFSKFALSKSSSNIPNLISLWFGLVWFGLHNIKF